MSARILFCTRCGSGYGSIGEIPPRCPACDRVTTWSTSAPVQPMPEPRVRWELNVNDRRLLRSLRIQSDP